MANFEQMIPFLLNVEAGLHPDYMSLPLPQQFARAKKTGYANDPNDSGGPTMCGVTLATYSSWRKKLGIKTTTTADLKKITFNEWRDILKSLYWDRCKADSIRWQMTAVAIVDWCWGSGIKGIKRVQQLLGVEADGIVGPRTLGAINGYPDQRALFHKIQDARNAFHLQIALPGTKNAGFLKGWNRRVAKITWDGFKY